MLPAGTIVENILRAAHGQNDDDMRTRVWSLLNIAYYEIAKVESWQLLRKTLERDFDDMSGTDGMYLPSNLFGIDLVRDADDEEIIYWPRDKYNLDAYNNGYRYFTYSPETTEEYFADDASVSKGAELFTSADLLADGTDYTGDYVRFGRELGYYLLTGAFTFEPKYYGPDLSGEDFYIRPRETRKIVCVDSNEAVVTDRSVNVSYWEAPTPLYRESELSILPSDHVLELMVLRKMPEAKSRRPVSKSEIDEALTECRGLNPDFEQDMKKRDKDFNLFTFRVANMYKDRTDV